jgi:hypothetical protein
LLGKACAGVSIELRSEASQSAVRGGPDGSGALAEYPSGAFGIEPDDNPEQDGFRLILGQGCDPVDRGARTDCLHRPALGVVEAGQAGEVFKVSGHAWASLSAPEMIESTVSCDRGGPAAESAALTAVGADIARDL